MTGCHSEDCLRAGGGGLEGGGRGGVARTGQCHICGQNWNKFCAQEKWAGQISVDKSGPGDHRMARQIDVFHFPLSLSLFVFKSLIYLTFIGDHAKKLQKRKKGCATFINSFIKILKKDQFFV